MLGKLKRYFFKQGHAGFPQENGVSFIHHNPSRGNLGDYLCSPRHYFSFQKSVEGLHVVGGGVFVDFAVEKIEKHKIPFEKTVLWGVGQSLRGRDAVTRQVMELPYVEWGVRDKDCVEVERFLPCVSCLHPMLDLLPADSGTLVFLNADPKVTSSDLQLEVAEAVLRRGWVLLYNNCSAQEFISHFAVAQHIVTNSYHGAYWGLLSGRRVTLFGYSSKFTSLLHGFGIDGSRLIRVERGDLRGLCEALKAESFELEGIELERPVDIRQEYRARNMQFAQKLVAAGLVSSMDLKELASGAD